MKKKRKKKIYVPVIIEVLWGFSVAWLRNQFNAFKKFILQVNEDFEITKTTKNVVDTEAGKIKCSKCKKCNMNRKGECMIYQKDIIYAVLECKQFDKG